MDDFGADERRRRRAEELVRIEVDANFLASLGPATVRDKLMADHERLSSSGSPLAYAAVRRP